MTRTHDWSTISVEGTQDSPRVSLYQKFGPYAEGDSVILRDGTYLVTKVGTEYTKRNGWTAVDLRLKAQS